MLRGEIGTPLTLTIYRENGGEYEWFEVDLIRDEIRVDSLSLDFLETGDKTVAYLKLDRFGERTYDEWNNAVSEILLRKQGIDGVILDLRNNPGGYFNEAIHVASEFVKNGVIVSEKGRASGHEFRATGNGRLTDVPVVVLTNRGSASSSEIVAGALRDNKRAQLVGTSTFGKGLIQERIELVNDAGLNVTVARWMLPNGEWIGEEGINPDVEVENDTETEEDEVLEKALSLF